MKRRTFLKKTAFASLSAAASPWIVRNSLLSSPAKALFDDNIQVITLTGTPRQRGQIHGETLRTKIQDIISVWKDLLSKQYKIDPDKYIEEFVENTHFKSAIEKWTPGLLEEVKGIAESANIDYKTFFAYQLGDEEWWFGRNRRYGIKLPERKNCSALGVFGQEDLPVMMAQNMDLPGYTDGHQVLLHIKHENSGVESFVFTFSGYISTTGMNNHGIGICCNTLLQLDQRADGLPVAYIVRGVLEQKTYADAVKFIHAVKHASGQNYTIGGPEEAASFECSANKVSRFIPYKGAKRVYHTNHPLVNDDQGIYTELLNKFSSNAGRRSGPSNSEIRLKALEKRIKDPAKRITIDTIKETLSSHDDPRNPVCNDRREGGGGLTAGCPVMVLSPDDPVLHIAPGPPCSTPFTTLKF